MGATCVVAIPRHTILTEFMKVGSDELRDLGENLPIICALILSREEAWVNPLTRSNR